MNHLTNHLQEELFNKAVDHCLQCFSKSPEIFDDVHFNKADVKLERTSITSEYNENFSCSAVNIKLTLLHEENDEELGYFSLILSEKISFLDEFLVFNIKE